MNQYQTKLAEALQSIVNPMLKDVDMEQVNDSLKQFAQMGEVPFQNLTKEEYKNLLIGATLLQALNHFAQAQKLSKEELELAMLLLFPEEENKELE